MDPASLNLIRVRGKPGNTNRLGQKVSNGNRMKRPEELAINRRSARKVVRRPPINRKPICRLEILPPEILEQIFAFSLSPNVAEASPFIGRVVSTERIYRSFMLYAFFEDNYVRLTTQQWRPITEDDELHETIAQSSVLDRHAFRPVEYQPLSDEDRLGLQKQIMSRRWFTNERFQKMLPKLYELSWKQQIAWEHNLGNCSLEIVESVQELPVDADRYRNLSIEEIQQPRPSNVMPALMERTRGLLSFNSQEQVDDTLDQPRQYFWYLVPYCRVRHIPVKLLLPKDESDKQFLALLIGRDLYDQNYPIDVDPKVLAEGIRRAVDLGQDRVLSCFIELISYGLHQSASPERLQDEVLPLLFPPQIFHTAVQKARQNSQTTRVLNILCNNPLIQWIVPPNDKALTKWAVEHRDSEKLARQLLNFMEQYQTMHNPEVWDLIVQDPLIKGSPERCYKRR